MFFDLIHKEKNTHARAGVIHTGHGDIPTPAFMPVGTQATVKSLDSRDLHELEAPVILGNTYHLHLRPGEDLVADFGGLHKFMNWDKPILTDSGGFQVFSLGMQKKGIPTAAGTSSEDTAVEPQNEQGKLVKIDEEGVTFRSYIDGSEHRFTPEKAIEIQHKLGADIIMAFDECTPDGIDEEYTREAMERTHRWAKRCIDYHRNLPPTTYNLQPHKQHLFGIIQGSNHKHLREESARYISSLDFDGIAIGGESIGYNMEITKDILDWVYPIIPENKPHYTMGLGFSPMDLFDAVEHGADMFDCVAPTRIARNGSLFVHPQTLKTKNYRLNITNAQFTTDQDPIDKLCDCTTCLNYTRSYLHHLFNAEELLAYRLATIHNIHFFLKLMRQMREAILADKFLELKKEWAI